MFRREWMGGAFNDNGATPNTITGNPLGGVDIEDVTGSVSFTSTTRPATARMGRRHQRRFADGGADGQRHRGQHQFGRGLEVGGVGTTASFTSSTFSTNTFHGISLTDVGGLASLTGVTANDNGSDGLHALDGSRMAAVCRRRPDRVGFDLYDTIAGNAQAFGVFVGDVDGAVLFNDNGATPNTITGNDSGGVDIEDVTGSVTFTRQRGQLQHQPGRRHQCCHTDGGPHGQRHSGHRQCGDGLEVRRGRHDRSFTSSTFSSNTSHGISLTDVVGLVT